MVEVQAPNDLPRVWRTILVNHLNVRGFIITDHYDRFLNPFQKYPR